MVFLLLVDHLTQRTTYEYKRHSGAIYCAYIVLDLRPQYPGMNMMIFYDKAIRFVQNNDILFKCKNATAL